MICTLLLVVVLAIFAFAACDKDSAYGVELVKNGDFATYGLFNCESTAQVLTALTSLGLDPLKDARFIKNGKTVLEMTIIPSELTILIYRMTVLLHQKTKTRKFSTSD